MSAVIDAFIEAYKNWIIVGITLVACLWMIYPGLNDGRRK
jgi:hypothetical protein